MKSNGHLLLLLIVAIASQTGYGQDLNSVDGAAHMVGAGGLFNAACNICYTVGTICGIIGGVVAYREILDGEETFFVAVRNWFWSCVLLLAFPIIIRGLTDF